MIAMNQIKENEKTLSLPLLVASLIVSLIFAIGSSMTSVRKVFNSETEERKILSKVFAEYGEKVFVVFKIKTQNGIEVEIFEKDVYKGEQKFKQKFILSDDVDAYLMINSDSLNLGLVDVNKDGQLDVICPTVDKSGNSRLNVFQYNVDLSQFVPVSEGD